MRGVGAYREEGVVVVVRMLVDEARRDGGGELGGKEEDPRGVQRGWHCAGVSGCQLRESCRVENVVV